MRRFAILAIVGMTIAASPAFAQSNRPQPRAPQMTPTEQLNQTSLERARAGQNPLAGGPDTTQNLNRMSDDAARRGQNMNQAPLPLR
jgi:hypothetical protein